MNYNHPVKNSSTVGIRLMCAIVFLCFSFCWTYFFQADVLMMAQHVLSSGMTHYNMLLGAVIITVSLYLVQLLVYGLTRLKKRSHALTYGPSMVLLAMITAVEIADDGSLSAGFSWWLPVIVIPLWLLMVGVAKMVQDVEDDRSFGLLSRPMWINMLLMALMIMGVTWVANTDAVFHYRMHAERCLVEGDADGALSIGKRSLESDEHLLMLRMYALARKGELGESLFEYPITGTSRQMLPTDSLSTLLVYPVDSLYRFLGARPAAKMSPMKYLSLVQQRDTIYNKVVDDYLLCGYLIDKQLDQFAAEVGRYYQVNDSLPRHYREALTLYTHLRAQPIVVYHNSVMDEDYDNLLELKNQYPNLAEQRQKIMESTYKQTYWYYYEYE